MALSPTSQTPPSKLAVVAVKTGATPSTLTYKRCTAKPYKNSTASSSDDAAVTSTATATTISTTTASTATSSSTNIMSRSTHSLITKTESSHSDPGHVTSSSHVTNKQTLLDDV